MLTSPLTADEREFVVKNLRLVYHFARKYRAPDHTDYRDLVSVGSLALVEGRRTHDANRGPLGYWLSMWVRSKMIKWLRRNHSVVHRALNGEMGSRDASLDAPRYEDDPEGDEWLDTLPHPGPTPEAEMLATERERIVREALLDLGDDAELLYARQVATLDEIGRIVGLTRTGVAFRAQKAMRRLSYALADVR